MSAIFTVIAVFKPINVKLSLKPNLSLIYRMEYDTKGLQSTLNTRLKTIVGTLMNQSRTSIGFYDTRNIQRSS